MLGRTFVFVVPTRVRTLEAYTKVLGSLPEELGSLPGEF